MITIDDSTTIGQAFFAAAETFGDKPFLCVPANAQRGYHQGGWEISYADAAKEVRRLMEVYRAAGLGHGQRIATLLENRPEYFLHKLALNALGVSAVPINPDYRSSEISYLLEHSEPSLALVLGERREQIAAGREASRHHPPVVTLETFGADMPRMAPAGQTGLVTAASEASILYTSGTTGRPKGCILSHGYELASGAWYATRGGLATMHDGAERIYNPLPLYHVNAGVVSFYGAMLRGNCQIQPDRFHPQLWWHDVKATRATIIHYLGIIVPLLMGRAPSAEEKGHRIRLGLGGGVEPTLHAAFEERFGFPLVELWGMTEMVRVLTDNAEPRQVGTRAFGRAVPGIDTRVVDENDRDVPDGRPGELVVRYSAETPRKHCFSGYLKDAAATEQAWRGGWFHTGDTVWRGADGMLHFVDRKKNIIRRSGENIAAAEIEALLLTHPDVKQVAVMAVPDKLREEEVLACIVLNKELPAAEAADAIFRFCFERLAYYKAPGWIWFTENLPVTGTQKIQKHQIFPKGSDPRQTPGMIDLRNLKRRK
jgi:acyl-CoA synthetase (AMP-forming)/AMP-acid ligase II